MSNILIILAGVLGIIAIIARPQLTLFLLMTTTSVKGWVVYKIPMLNRGVLDYTIIVMVLSALAIAIYQFRKTHNVSVSMPNTLVFVMILFAFYMWLSLSWSASSIYGLEKSLQFTFIVLPYFLFPIFVIRSRKDADWVLRTLLLIGFVACITAIVQPQSETNRMFFYTGYDRATFLGGSPAALGEAGTWGFLTALCVLLTKKCQTKTWKIFTWAVMPICVIGVLLSGSRSSLMLLILLSGFVPVLTKKRYMGYYANGIGVVVAAGVLLMIILASESVPRNIQSMGDGRYIEMVEQSRGFLWHWTLSNVHDVQPLGGGAGSWAVHFAGLDTMICAHNIFLEGLYEFGIIGLVLLIAVVIIVGKKIHSSMGRISGLDTRAYVAVPIILSMFMFARSQMSYDIGGVRNMFLCFGMVYAMDNLVQQIDRNAKNNINK